MWVAKSAVEVETARKRREREAVFIALALAVLLGAWLTCCRKTRDGPALKEPADMRRDFPVAVCLGLLIGGLASRADRKRQRRVVCPVCETSKLADGGFNCPCGGRFRDLDELRWIEPEPNPGPDRS